MKHVYILINLNEKWSLDDAEVNLFYDEKNALTAFDDATRYLADDPGAQLVLWKDNVLMQSYFNPVEDP